MHISHIDHLVITTGNLDACLRFYADLLGMTHTDQDGRHSLTFGSCKINIHTHAGEFQPAAATPTSGSLDFCLIVDNLLEARCKIMETGYPLTQDLVTRHGACGTMQSIYLRDPDGNLVELSQYE